MNHSSKTTNIVVILGDPSRPDQMKPDSIFDEDDFFTIDSMKKALSELKGYNFTFLTSHDSLISDLAELNKQGKIDYVLNLCDEGYYNDPTKELHVPSLLEIFGIKYTGSNPQCLAFCYDKSLIRGVAKEMRVPVPEAFLIQQDDISFSIPFGFPVLVKPNFGDSSFGITQKSVANNEEELAAAVAEIRDKLGYDKPILVEEFLPGKDLSVGIIGNPPNSYIVLPITEEDYSAVPSDLPKICGYEAKWMPDSPYWKIKSVHVELPEDTKKEIVDCCIRLIERLGCRDYSRLDWRLDSKGRPKLLEVNPNPGWCWDGHLAKMSKIAGMSYSDMLGAILKAVEKRMANGKKHVKISENGVKQNSKACS